MTLAMTADTALLLSQLSEDGFAVARRYIDAQTLGRLNAEADALIGRFHDEGYRSDDFWCYDVPGHEVPMLYRIHNLENQGAASVASLFGSGVLHDLASALLGAAASTVCAMVVKTPGVAGVPWHRDRTDVPPLAAVNLSIFLDDSTTDNGCFEAVPGSHRLADDVDVTEVHARGPIAPVPAGRGDVLVHDVRLVHGSGANPSALIRRSVITEFAVPDDR